MTEFVSGEGRLALHHAARSRRVTERRMRELERDGGVAWLRERERRGDLERWRIELAAYCGDADAAEVLGWRDETCCCGDGYRGHTGEHMFVHACDWLRGLERWPGALREAELACDVVMWGEEKDPYPWRDGAAGMARWICVVAERRGEQRVREAICERLRQWALR